MTKGAGNFMRECLLLALRGAGRVSPNPMVGALLVKGTKVVSWGWHHEFGGTHAEVDCLRRAHGGARGATLYVNLEPCSHHGKTPPCTEALIEAGVRHVVIAMRDPNPLVSGCGVKRLRGAGIEVVEGILKDEARFLNRFFCTHILSGRPYVHVKVAESLDGRITGGNSRWITSLPSRRGVLDLDLVLAELYNTGIGSILVEGGAGVNARLSEAGLIDEFSSFIAPAIHGGGLGAFESVESRSPAPSGFRNREIASGLHRKPAFLSIEGRNPVSFRSPASASGKNKAVAMRTITVYNSGGDVLIRAFREKYRFTDLEVGS